MARNAAAPVAAIDPAQAQHQGRRDSQQDACGFSDLGDEAFAVHGGHLAVLADGMGGMRNGLWAASHAVQAFIQAYQAKTAAESIPAALQRALAAANGVVHAEAERLNAVDRMGTTLAVAVVRGLELHWLNVGDSRVYLVEDGHLMCLSTDHSYAQILKQRVHRGELSAGEALGHPLRHALTSYLGRPAPVQHAASRAAVQLRPGARVLLCSDGLTQALDDDRIRSLLTGEAQEACDRLLQAALARSLPDQDNTTAVLLHVPNPGEMPDAGSISRSFYDPQTQRLAQGLPPETDPPPAGSGRPGLPLHLNLRLPLRLRLRLRPRWREPLWWAGALAALAALGLLWLARPAPKPAPAAPRPAASVDLLQPGATAAPGPAASGPGGR